MKQTFIYREEANKKAAELRKEGWDVHYFNSGKMDKKGNELEPWTLEWYRKFSDSLKYGIHITDLSTNNLDRIYGE